MGRKCNQDRIKWGNFSFSKWKHCMKRSEVGTVRKTEKHTTCMVAYRCHEKNLPLLEKNQKFQLKIKTKSNQNKIKIKSN
jgi:hypothetical protein